MKAIFADLRNCQKALGARLVPVKKQPEPADAADWLPRPTPAETADPTTAARAD